MTDAAVDLPAVPDDFVAIGPPIAGRQASYSARQIWDIKLGARNGDRAKLMKPAVEKLTEDDLIAISAYVASRQP